ncbi:MAG: hypothetical protein R3C04_07835 [Hyphomonas sp.]
MVLQQRSSAYAAGCVRVDTFKDIAATARSSPPATPPTSLSAAGPVPVTDQSGVNAPPTGT